MQNLFRDKDVIRMNAKNKLFVSEYIKDMNAAKAAIRAGYSKKTARSIGQRLLTKVDIKKAVETELEEVRKANIAEAIEVEEFLTLAMRGKKKEEVLIGVGGGEQRVGEIQVSMKDRIKAAELLGKRYALFTDKKQITGAVPVVIVDDIVE